MQSGNKPITQLVESNNSKQVQTLASNAFLTASIAEIVLSQDANNANPTISNQFNRKYVLNVPNTV